jgi:predicted glycogen debranching enzyme
MDQNAEWLEADGLGGFASGTVGGPRTRRYHAVLLTATTPPTGRFVLVNGFDASVETDAGHFAISSQRYIPGVTHPDGSTRIERFTPDPWPTWTFRLDGGTRVEQSLFVPRGKSLAAITWKLLEPRNLATLVVRPFLSGRDYHLLHHENPVFQFDAQVSEGTVGWRPYPRIPLIETLSNGQYVHEPQWYRNFQYDEERSRGLDFTEDLASPGYLRWDLTRGEAVWLVGVQLSDTIRVSSGAEAVELARSLCDSERRRRQKFPTRLHCAADAYVVSRGKGKTIVAGYPWFTDWGRDTFVSLRGLCLATGRLDDAHQILVEWAATVSEGMLPNRFTDRGGDAAEFNSVDASLWYIIAVHDFMQMAEAAGRNVSQADQQTLRAAVDAILTGYSQGTRYGIRLDRDGLLAAGERGIQLTWMDAKVGDWVVTPRIGKPVEVQALWLNALWIGTHFVEKWGELFEQGGDAFRRRFWNERDGSLYDVVDPNHEPGTADATFRPNQIFAVGGLPLPLLDGERARRVVDAVEEQLWTPLGLRSLAPGSPGYVPRYEGGVLQRDGAYHQGTVWPWLIGPFVEAWVRTRGATSEAKRQARTRFLEPLLRQLDDAGLVHICEIADADPPHTPRGCPCQAWSVGEALRLAEVVLADSQQPTDRIGSSARRSDARIART